MRTRFPLPSAWLIRAARPLRLVAGAALVVLGLGLLAQPLVGTSGVAPAFAEAAPAQPVGPADAATVAAVRAPCLDAGAQEFYGCHLGALQRALEQEGAGVAFGVLEALAADDEDVARVGHPLAHDLGRFAFRHYGSAPEAFLHCPPNMASGCHHGVLEAFLGGLGRDVEREDLAGLCGGAIAQRQGAFGRFQCLHGLGHGLMMALGHDLARALSSCDLLPTVWERESCYGGAFMENIVSLRAAPRAHGGASDDPHAGHHMKSHGRLDAADPHYPCDALDPKYGAACYLMQSSAILYLNGHDFRDAFATCDTAPAEWVSICYESMGRDVTGFTLWEPRRTIELCGLGSAAHRVHCVMGAAKSFANAEARTEPAFAFCRGAAPPDKAGCYGAVGEMLRVLVPSAEARAEACRQEAEAAHVQDCRSSAAA